MIGYFIGSRLLKFLISDVNYVTLESNLGFEWSVMLSID